MTLEIHYKIFDNIHLKFGKKAKVKILKKHFLRPVNHKPNFYTNWICYLQVRFCSYYAFSLSKMSDFCEVWKYWPLKDGFRSTLQKFSVVIMSIHWFIKSSKYQQFLFWKKNSKKPQIFHVFKGPLFRNGWPYWYECWRVLRNSCGLSKKCGFAAFPKI